MTARIVIAKACHEAHSAYCESIGEQTRDWESLPDEHIMTIISSIEKIQQGEFTSPKMAHENFFSRKVKDGWTHGDEYSAEDKISPRLVVYSNLKDTDKIKEGIFFGVVTALTQK